jgi:hypothetical protein
MLAAEHQNVRRAVVAVMALNLFMALACARGPSHPTATIQSRPAAAELQARWDEYRQKHANAISISEGVTPPELVEKADVDSSKPDFKTVRVGIYIFDFVVNERGEVVDPFFLRGPEGGGETYLLSLLAKWRYKPALKDGKPVPVFITITWHFCA